MTKPIFFPHCLQIAAWGMLCFKLYVQTQFLLRALCLNSDNCYAEQKPQRKLLEVGLEWKECRLEKDRPNCSVNSF